MLTESRTVFWECVPLGPWGPTSLLHSHPPGQGQYPFLTLLINRLKNCRFSLQPPGKTGSTNSTYAFNRLNLTLLLRQNKKKNLSKKTTIKMSRQYGSSSTTDTDNSRVQKQNLLRLRSTYFEQRYQGNSLEERIVFLANCWKNCMITYKED